VELGEGKTNLHELKIFAIILQSQPLLGRHLGFCNSFHAVFFCMDSTFLYSLAVFTSKALS